MAIAIKREEARLVIAAKARQFADFVEFAPELSPREFDAAVQGRLDELTVYVMAFKASQLTIGDKS